LTFAPGNRGYGPDLFYVLLAVEAERAWSQPLDGTVLGHNYLRLGCICVIPAPEQSNPTSSSAQSLTQSAVAPPTSWLRMSSDR
jgi:hypothetical protein